MTEAFDTKLDEAMLTLADDVIENKFEPKDRIAAIACLLKYKALKHKIGDDEDGPGSGLASYSERINRAETTDGDEPANGGGATGRGPSGGGIASGNGHAEARE